MPRVRSILTVRGILGAPVEACRPLVIVIADEGLVESVGRDDEVGPCESEGLGVLVEEGFDPFPVCGPDGEGCWDVSEEGFVCRVDDSEILELGGGLTGPPLDVFVFDLVGDPGG